MLFKIAWRNIWRNRTRSLVVIASVAVGLFAGVFIIAFFQGAVKQESDSTVETQLSHIQFHNPAFIDDKDANYTINNGLAIIGTLKKDINARAVAGGIITAGVIFSPSAALGVELHGLVPADEQAVSSISKNVIEG